MKFKTQILLIIIISINLTLTASCNKKGCMHEDAANFDSTAKREDGSCVFSAAEEDIKETNTFILNEIIDFSITGSQYVSSFLLTRTGVVGLSTVNNSHCRMHSVDTIPGLVFNRSLKFEAKNGAELFGEYTNGNTQLEQARKFVLNEKVDGSGIVFPPQNGSAFARVLGDNVQSTFTQNSTQYLGLSFKEGSDTYYGWVKIKTFSNNYSCEIISYDVAIEPNKAVTIK